MEIRRAEYLGFCSGVRQAVDLAEKHLAQNGQLYALGALVHNPRLIAGLAEKGMQTVDEPDALPDHAAVILRAHGVGPGLRQRLQEKQMTVLDATCPSVQLIFNYAKKYAEQGDLVLILGEKGHPEVEAILEWTQGNGIIIESLADLNCVAKNRKIAVVSQSTLAEDVFKQFVLEIRRIFDIDVVINTICSATKNRQEAAVKLAQEADLMLVVGSSQSANSRHLYDLCFAVNTRTHLITGAADLCSCWFTGTRVVGITAGASVPDWIIKEVECTVLENENKVIEGEETKVPEVEEKTAAEAEPVSDTAEKAAESVVTPEVPAAETEEFDMDSFHLPRYTPGDIIQATVVQVGNDEILVDVGQKSEGIIPRKEFSADPSILPTDVLKVGDEITVMVVRNEDQEGRLTFSKKRADQRQYWVKFTESLNKNEVMEGKVLEQVKGGLIVDIGIRAFMPASLAERRFTSDLKHLIGETVRVRLVEVDPEKRRAIVNRKIVLEEEAAVAKEAFWQNTHEGDVVKGIVRRITKFGAFVDLGGIDGLLHISDLDYYRVKDPSDVVKINDELELKVLKLDAEAGRISLGLKQMKMEPWEAFAQEYAAGDVVQGTVVRITPWGAFVNVRPGIDGLIHISELENHRVEKVEDVVAVGQQVEAKILDIDLNRKRLSLSLKALQTEEGMDEAAVEEMKEEVNEGNSNSER
ncbi:MAG: bifunctional 4-hydroxy-3-methylbut-2-enyl diphosphate reductase/30S ribosomal protein S1 [Negativicutes bacterium]|nr:bifunctional 4-hydroxy-3-methylbut-2-enyl diphosphate reductase/30S ribosomal protein S1 [Negativicutes bacterium]